MADYSLFNAMDGGFSFDALAFDQSLALNVLFQDKMLVYDGSFFTCPNLIRHLSQRPGHHSLFESACRMGLIVPALRDHAHKSLRESASALLKSSSGYQLQEMEGYRERVITAVDDCLEKGIASPFYWPKNAPPLGEGYNDTVRRLLQRDEPPEYTAHNIERARHFDRIWSRTEPWRRDVIDAAAIRTVKGGHLGLRRQEVYNELGLRLGISQQTRDVSFENLMMINQDPEDKLALEIFLKWLAQCHFINQGKAFDVAINFPVYHIDEDFILDSIARTPMDSEPSKESGFRCEVSLPSFALLARSNPEDLLAIRADLGGHYLSTLAAWQQDHSDANLHAVQQALKFYCGELTARYKELTPIKCEVKFGKGRVASVAGAVVGFINDYDVPILTRIAKLGIVIYKFLSEERLEKNHMPQRQKLEVTLPRYNDI